MTQKGKNNVLFESLMRNPNLSETEKNHFRNKWLDFDFGFFEASREVYLQQCHFNDTFVLLEGSNRRCEAEYLPRTFTLYSLAQKTLLKNLLKEFQAKNLVEKFFVLSTSLEPNFQPRQHQDLYYGLCHFSCLHQPCPTMKEPFLTLKRAFYRLGCRMFANRLKKGGWTELKLLTQIKKVLLLLPTEVKADVECLQLMFPSLPPPVLKDFVAGLIYFSLADLLLYSYGPDPDPEFIDVDAYLKHFVSDAPAVWELPQVRWQPF